MIAETARIYSKNIGESVEIRDYAIVYDGATLENNVIIGEHSVIGRSATPTSVMKKRAFEVKGNGNIERHGDLQQCHYLRRRKNWCGFSDR